MKKRSLADLFKELKKIGDERFVDENDEKINYVSSSTFDNFKFYPGLSYRKGINICQQNSLKNPMLVDTSDLSKRLKNMDNIMEDK